MALLGFSLIIASFVLFCMRRPAWFPAIFGGPPRPPIGAPPEDDPETESKPADDRPSTAETITRNGQPGNHDSNLASGRAVPAQRQPAARIPMPPPPVIQLAASEPSAALGPPSVDSACDDSQTTPKASAATLTTPVPAFALSAPDPTPSTSKPPAVSASASALMPPPPRPPTLRPPPTGAAAARSSSRTLPIPARGPQRQPGCSTLAPPPTHSAKPAKPSRAVVLTPGHSPLDWARLSDHPAADLRGLPPGTPYLRVTPSMLKKMTGRRGKDAWTAMGGRVYNISPYLPFHPGGEAELLRGAGRDGTRLFGEVHPWVNYEGMLAACLVGIYVPEEEGGEAKGAGGGGGAAAGGDMEAMD